MFVMTRNSLYVAWFWERGADTTEIVCDTSMVSSSDRCSDSVILDDDDVDIYSFTSSESTDLRKSRVTLDASIRETLKIATRTAPSTGTSVVGMEGTY